MLLAMPAWGSSGYFDRAWGENVVSAGPGNTGSGFEICVAAAGDTCQAVAATAPALGGEMNFPVGVAVDGTGNVYVTDTGHHRVQKFNSSGVFERAWGEDVVSTGPGNFGGFEICVPATGAVCQTGTASAATGGMDIPYGIATDSTGNVYVADSNNHRIQVFDPSGFPFSVWGEDVIMGSGTGYEICVTLIDPCKKGETTAPALGGEMNSPWGIATDSADNVYVGDSNHHRVQKFNPAGTFERAWGEDVISANASTGFEVCVALSGDICKTGLSSTTGVAPALGGDMSNPRGVAVDAAANVYVADSGYHRIQKFSSAGAFDRAWGEDVISANASTGFEVCVAASGHMCQTGTTSVTSPPALGGEMEGPAGVAVDGSGNVYVADSSHHRLQKFSSLGVFERLWGEDVASAGPGNTGTGFEICVAAAGDVCQIGIFTAPALAGEMAGPLGVASDPVGTVYVADSFHNRIQKFTDPPPSPPPGGGGAAPAGATGQRAAALKKCKKKKRPKARRKCRRRARKLPI